MSSLHSELESASVKSATMALGFVEVEVALGLVPRVELGIGMELLDAMDTLGLLVSLNEFLYSSSWITILSLNVSHSSKELREESFLCVAVQLKKSCLQDSFSFSNDINLTA